MDSIKYDVAVVGGGIAAVFHACALAEQGRKVVILAGSTSLMHEIGLSRLPLYGSEQLAERYPLVRAWINLLESHNGMNGERMEPVLVQMLMDKFVEAYGIDVLFEVLPINIEREAKVGSSEAEVIAGVRLATREGFKLVPCDAVVDCTDNGILLSGLTTAIPVDQSDMKTIWSLAFLQKDMTDSITELAMTLGNTRYDIRLAASHWGEEMTATVVVSSEEPVNRGEIRFVGVLEQLVKQIREQAGSDIGPLLHVSERSWSTPSYIIKPNSNRLTAGGNGGWLTSTDGSLIGIGCWTVAGHEALAEASQWEKGGAALQFLVESALEAAMASTTISK